MANTFIENVNKLANNLPDNLAQIITDLQTGKANQTDLEALTQTVDGKVDKITGKQLSTNDYTTVEKDKLALLDETLYERVAKKGIPNGYVPLNSLGKIDANFISALNLYTVYVSADEPSMLALPANAGDVCYRSDTGNSYMLVALPSSTLANWKQLNITIVSWNTIQGTPSTLSGYGITDAYTITQTNNAILALLNDITPSTTKAYSSSFTQSLHDAQAISIANLASSSGAIANTTTPVLSPIPLVATDVPFSVTTDSTDHAIFTFDDVNNTITFLRNGNFNFQSIVGLLSTGVVNNVLTTFNLVNTANSAIVKSTQTNISMANNTTEQVVLNTLLTVGSNGIPSAPLTLKIQALVASGTNLTFNSFSSILASSSISGSTAVADMDAALGAIYGGLA